MNLTAEQIRAHLPWQALTDALDDIFRTDVVAPLRHVHDIPVADGPDAALLLMPAWIANEYIGVKQVNVFPGNNTRGESGLTGHYLLSCGRTGRHLIEIDGNVLTARRTAAASALASRYLSRPESRSLLIVGTGRMASHLVPAHMSERDIDTMRIWGRRREAAEALAEQLGDIGATIEIVAPDALAQAVAESDIISCATLSRQPLVRGEWLAPGSHLDLVGSFAPHMREADDEAMRWGAVFVDTREGALAETGDLIDAIAAGAVSESDIHADLLDICGGAHAGRRALDDSADAITVFKSVGTSREDLAAAILAYRNASA
ncbi:bifunctional Delta(1)-pyrroline-2-carboxylate/Delta(1)-piperideine-2-carboxylate reductase [Salinisphaera orenii]|uniref:ornithine cyclodeaminase family protein n=1 Tax=Salinisphaera orenii TaxID=856731 RepID=UPI000DBE477E